MKLQSILRQRYDLLSLPSRERGLKSCYEISVPRRETVAPLAGAWIEIKGEELSSNQSKSLPSRERGLKSFCNGQGETDDRRSPRGSVD